MALLSGAWQNVVNLLFNPPSPKHRTARGELSAPGIASPRRGLVLLVVAVVVAHGLLLTNAAAWFGLAQTPDPAQPPVKTFATRRLAAAPAPAPLSPPTAVATAAPAAPAAAKTPVFKQKQPIVQVSPASKAIDLIAIESIAAPVAPATPAASASSAASSADITPSADPADVTAQTLPATLDSTRAEVVPLTGAAVAPAADASAASATADAASPPAITPVTSVALPASAILTYRMTGNARGLTYHASAELGWRNLGDRYDARMTVSALFLGSRSMASVGQLGTGGLAPTRFSDKSRSEVAAHFEPDKGLITFSANTPSAPWVPGAQDRVSVFFQISGLMAGNPADFPVGTTVVVYTAGPRSADTWAFTVAAEEVLTLPYGDIQTVKLIRKPQREYDQTVEIWLAPALSYLPVRNKITQSNGDFIDQQLSDLKRP